MTEKRLVILVSSDFEVNIGDRITFTNGSEILTVVGVEPEEIDVTKLILEKEDHTLDISIHDAINAFIRLNEKFRSFPNHTSMSSNKPEQLDRITKIRQTKYFTIKKPHYNRRIAPRTPSYRHFKKEKTNESI